MYGTEMMLLYDCLNRVLTSTCLTNGMSNFISAVVRELPLLVPMLVFVSPV
eukprot:CAMPEP_0119115286 /NCGR_PEP_ID=MMETSP1180-20130426/50464_1 /TAXON_ID=3052 ORGANISM="Chlamydomonas cf sp, Strain CCMP681" /NCGR_SAMPLE_ID=MMETSP1180 /ASSEMBLY_ACC=CAM_ASM_000741 /LENGTH=50 /DNA_ID=CAMNT_0007104191 /DNA_START=77 /DNA_END=226 /DNA_ORIENTATION=-